VKATGIAGGAHAVRAERRARDLMNIKTEKNT